MKSLRIALLIPLTAVMIGAEPVAVPAGLAAGRPGAYDLVVRSPDLEFMKNGLRALYYIPRSLARDQLRGRPLLVFFHGHTRDPNYYRTQIQQMKQFAERDRFSLLSVQNPWALNNDRIGAALDAVFGVNLMLHQLDSLELYRAGHVYTAGFSSGGFVAWLVCLQSLDQLADPEFRQKQIEYDHANKYEGAPPADYDVERDWYSWKSKAALVYPYAGFASFKGNYYGGVFQPNMLADGYGIPYAAYYPRIYGDRLGVVTVGGAADVPRVRTQAAELRDFMRGYLGLPLEYQEFPSEGHSLTQANWRYFWDKVESRLASSSE